MMVEVIPAILVASFEELRANLAKVKGLAKWAQIDVCDGFFVPSRTWPMNPGDSAQFERIVKGAEKLPYRDDFKFDLDLMVHNPEKIIPSWVKAGASRIAIHLAARHDFSACRAAVPPEVELGIGLTADTPLSRLAPLAGQFDYLQLMGIAAVGKQGQPFDERVLGRIREAKQMFPGVPIQIDGSVNAETAPRLVEAGAERLVSGSYILRAEDVKKAIETLANA